MNKKKLDILIEANVNVGSEQLTQEQIDFVNAVARGRNNRGRSITYKWSVVDGKVNVFGDVRIDGTNITHFPVQFNTISGLVSITSTDLADLTGLPNKLFSDLVVSNNQLTSLRGCPSIIKGAFYCNDNNLTNLSNFPSVKGGAYISNNPFQLNDKLFEDLKEINSRVKIAGYKQILQSLKAQIPIQFGIDKPRIINQIWKSYTDILEAE